MKNAISFIAGMIIGAVFMFPVALVVMFEIFDAAIAEANMRQVRRDAQLMWQLPRLQSKKGTSLPEECLINDNGMNCKLIGGKYAAIRRAD